MGNAGFISSILVTLDNPEIWHPESESLPGPFEFQSEIAGAIGNIDSKYKYSSNMRSLILKAPDVKKPEDEKAVPRTTRWNPCLGPYA